MREIIILIIRDPSRLRYTDEARTPPLPGDIVAI